MKGYEKPQILATKIGTYTFLDTFIWILSLKLRASSPLKLGRTPKGKKSGQSPNHHFQGFYGVYCLRYCLTYVYALYRNCKSCCMRILFQECPENLKSVCRISLLRLRGLDILNVGSMRNSYFLKEVCVPLC